MDCPVRPVAWPEWANGGLGRRKNSASRPGGSARNLNPDTNSDKDQPTSSSERLDQARHLLGIIAANDLRPILVLDDTDRWLNVSWQPESETLRSAFFGRVIRVLAEDLATAAVVAVHPTYLTDPDYQAASGFLDTTMRLPALPSAAAVGRVLARRVAVALNRETDPVLDGVVDPAALDLIFDQYRADPDVRKRVLQVAHLALTLAVDDSAEQLDEAHVQGAYRQRDLARSQRPTRRRAGRNGPCRRRSRHRAAPSVGPGRSARTRWFGQCATTPSCRQQH